MSEINNNNTEIVTTEAMAETKQPGKIRTFWMNHKDGILKWAIRIGGLGTAAFCGYKLGTMSVLKDEDEDEESEMEEATDDSTD